MRPSGSRAAAAFQDAHALLAGFRSGPERRPAFDAAAALPTRGPLPRPAPAAPDPTTLRGALAAQEAGAESAVSLLTAALEAAEANAALGGMVHIDPERAAAEAGARDAERAVGGRLGPLHGIPVTVKDIIDVAHMPTRCGSAAYDELPTVDAAGVARLRAAGAVVVGKAATHEFALGVTTPQARNPFDTTRIPGGSSGGSAIAVATGIGLGSLGTDTRASIRVPPALCGVVGLKGSYGLVPVDGVVTLSWTMDHVAPIAANVADAALMLEALAPQVAGLSRWAGAPVEGWRIGVPEAAFAGADPEVEAAVRGAIAALGEIGVRSEPAARPDALDLDRANGAGLVISRAEAAAVHRDLGLDRSLYWDETADQLAEAERLTAMDYLTAQRIRADLADALLEALSGRDALVMPTTPVTAPPVDRFAEFLTVLSRNAIPWSLVGFPAISVPCGFTSQGLPVGLQIVGPPRREDAVVALAAAVERTSPVARLAGRGPAVPTG
jgi:aspartyl-tRNA(Asn)/glutamyl-tRNA(Gln) amidotransferase subunit A